MKPERVIRLSQSEIESFRIVKDQGEHFIFDCPYCPIYYGPSSKGIYPKLYYHKEKGVGFCFRCKTAIVNEDLDQLERFQLGLKRMKKGLVPEEELKPLDPEVFYSLTVPLTEQGREYLLRRSPYLEPWLESGELGVRSLPGERESIAIPIWMDGQLLGYQLRYIDGGDPRYHLIVSGKKPIYSRKELPFNGVLTINEGIFGAWGAEYLGLPNPVAVFGSHLSDFQVGLIRRKFPSQILVNMDEPRLTEEVVRSLKEEIPYAAVEPVYFGDADELAVKHYSKRSKSPK